MRYKIYSVFGKFISQLSEGNKRVVCTRIQAFFFNLKIMSGKIRYISDPHFYHKNMAIKRGFSDEFMMNEHIVSSWNKVVKKKDTTWILGDITMEKSNYEILDKLNGFKKVILGNHDKGSHILDLLDHVNTVYGMLKVKNKVYGSIFLTHCPIHPQEFEYRVNYNIHGHIHDGYVIEDKRYVNVSMEVQDYTPKTLEELIK